MLHKLVSVKDKAAETFGRPFAVVALGQATRSFSDEVNRGSESEVSRHPEDFELWFIGEFDDVEGVLIGRKPEMICRGKDLSNRSE